jgi:hypothetical protein
MYLQIILKLSSYSRDPRILTVAVIATGPISFELIPIEEAKVYVVPTLVADLFACIA